MRKEFWRRVLSCLTTVSLIVNSLLPYSVASIVYAQEPTSLVDQEATIFSETPLPAESPSVSPQPDSTPAVIADPTPIPAPEATPTPTVEIIPTTSPEVTPSNLSPPVPTPTLELFPTPDFTPDLITKLEDTKTLHPRPKTDFYKDFQSRNINYVPGEVIVKYKQSKLNLKGILGPAQAFIFEKKYSLSKKDEIKSLNIQVFRSKKSTEELVKELKSDQTVEYAEPNYLRFPAAISTNDTYKDLLWGLDNTGQTVNGTVGINDADIDAPETWNVSDGSGNIIVAIIDSGVAYNHPDLLANMWDGSSCKDETGAPLGGCNHGYDFENDDNTPLPDSSDHGTHIAGIIAAAKNNAKGVIGVAPNAKIMALKYDLTVTNEIKAIDFAIQNGAKIINFSNAGESFSTPEYDAINRYRTAGGLFVAAAGNGGVDGIGDGENNDISPKYPSDYNLDNIISVAATDQNDSLATFSNYSSTSVDVGAPGTNIYSTIADIAITQPLDENFDSLTEPNIPSEWSATPSGFWGTFYISSTVGNVLFGDYYHYPYLQSANTTISTPAYDLSGSSAASIDFITACDTEYSMTSWADYMALEISSDNFSTSAELLRWDEVLLDLLNGDTSPAGNAVYYVQGLSIPSTYLNANFKLRFRWFANGNSDTGSTGDGCLVDDFTLSKYTRGTAEKYNYKNGTSMAAPYVAGLAALIWGYKPNLTSAQVKGRILQTGDSKTSLAGKTVSGKRINAYNALNGLNNPPTTSAGSTSTNEDTTVAITLSGNDVDGDSLTYSIVSSPTHGTLGIISGNQVTYTPALNYNGPDSFIYKANDGLTDSNTSTVTITINPVNDPPIANPQSVTTNEDTAYPIALSGSDVDGNTITYAIVSNPTHGTLGTLSGNAVTYTPSADYNGSDSFTFKVNDGTVDSNTATVTITVTPVNDAPVLNPIGNKTVDELTNLTFTATAIDPDSSVTYSRTGAPTGATINSSTGMFSFTPTEAQGPGEYTLTVNVTDGVATDSENIKVTVNEVNIAPVAQDDSSSTVEDIAKLITLFATDSDMPVNTLTYSIVSIPSHGSVSVTGNQATYTPSTNYNGLDPFIFKVNDGISDSNIATFTITVISVNDAPVASNDSVSTDEDNAKTVTLNTNDPDIPADTLSFSIVTNPSHGTVTLMGNQATYTPNENYNGSDAFTFKANDGFIYSNIGTISVTVNPVNDAPVSVADGYTTNEDITLNVVAPGVLTNDSDIDSPSLSSVLVSDVSHGNLALNANGSFSYIPAANYNGSDSFTYKVNDGTADSNTSIVSVSVTPVNDAPTAVPDTASVDEDTPLIIAKTALLANDLDIDGDSLTLTGVANPIHGTVSISVDNVVFTPTSNYSGPASFDYTVSDSHLTSTATVTINVNSVNDAPVVNPQTVTIEENTPIVITLVGNDVDGDPPSYSIVSGVSHGTLGIISGNQISYTPNNSYNGTDSFEFKVNDGTVDSNHATVSITITPFNDPPVLGPIGNFTVNELEGLTFTANATDPDEGETLIYSLNNNSVGASIGSSTGVFSWTPTESQGPGEYTFSVIVSDGVKTDSEEITVKVNEVNQAPIAESVSVSTNEDIAKTVSLKATDSDLPANTLTYSIVSGVSHGTLGIISGNQITYTPESNYNGTDSFTYKVNDGVLDSNTATVSLTISPANDAPLAVDDIPSTDEDTALIIAKFTLLNNDSDVDGDTLNLINVSNPINGLVAISGSNIIFTPAPNFNGIASFDYTISDGDLTDTATVTITINPVNDAPVADSQSISTDEDTPVAIILSGSDIEGNTLYYSLINGPSNGTLGEISGNGITYTPNSNYSGNDSFEFKANDGMVDSNTATVSVTVAAVNDPPVLAPVGNHTIDELANLTFAVSATDPDSSLTYSLSNAPTGATINPTTGVFSFTPSETQGPGEYTLTVSVNDGIITDFEEITITVNEVNVAPVTLADSLSTNEDTTKTITLSASDSDFPVNTLIYSIVSGVSHGVLGTISGNQLTYTPSADYNGEDSFIFKVNDGTVDSNTSTVTINVISVNDAPVANPDTASVDEDTILTITKSSLLANDTDVDGDLLTLGSVSNSVNGIASIVANDVVFTPDANYFGPASFGYTVSDGSLTDTTTVAITVNPVNDAPISSDSVVITSQDTPVTINFSASDIDGDPLTYSIETGASNGVLGDVSGNQVIYTPNSSYVGSDTFTFKTNDGNVDSNIATVSITVNPPPVISSEATNTPGVTSITITWTTDHPSTSRVIYDTVSHTVLDVAPNYGYANSTVETDTSLKVTLHSVTITGLTAGTAYYYRVVSHGSPEVVGEENTFATANEKTTSGGEVAGTSTTSPNSSVCSDQKPGSAPTLISITSSSPNEATLIWTKAKDPVTYYLIAFGTKSGEMLYGNPSVGGKDTTSYTVKGLSSKTKYFFKVRAGNNCMPGDFSNELSTKIYGETLNEIPAGFSPGVLGTEDTTTGEVLGKETVSPTPEISPVPQLQNGKSVSGGLSHRIIVFTGIGIVILIAGYIFFIRRRRE